MAIKIAIANQKGGIGKTTTALNVADALKHSGYDVLFLDVDPQCNSTGSYNAIIEGENTLYDVLEKKCEPEDAIQHTAMGDIIPGDPALSEIENKLLTSIGGYNSLKKIIQKIEDKYDFVIMDTPPNLGIYMIAALTAATGIIVPMKAEKYAIDGLRSLIRTINDVMENSNPELNIYGILLTAYDIRNNLDRDTWQRLPSVGDNIGMNVFSRPIRICQAIKNTQSEMTSLFDAEPSSTAAIDYAEIVKELLEVIKHGQN